MKMSRLRKAATLDLNMMALGVASWAYGLLAPTPVSLACRHRPLGVKPKVQDGSKEVKFSAAFVFNPLSVLSCRFDPTPGRSTITGILKLSSSAFGPMPLSLRS